MSSSNIRLKKIKVNMEYKGKTFCIDAQPFKPISYLREQAKKYFYQMKEEVNIEYRNRDISEHEATLLGEFFQNKTNVTLRLKPLLYSVLLNNKKSLDMTRMESFPMIKGITPNSMRSQYSRNALSNKNTHNHSINTNNTNNYNNNNNQSTVDGAHNFLCLCVNGKISHYCRTCRLFICNNCRGTGTHIQHSTIHIDIEHMEESTKLYALTIQETIETNLQSFKEYYSQMKQHSLIQIYTREEMFKRKVEQVQALYKEMMAALNNKDAELDEKVIDELTHHAKVVQNDLNQVLIQLYQKHSKGKTKMSFEEMKETFNNLQNQEKGFEDKSCDAFAYQINHELNTQIDEMYKRLEEVINDYTKEIPMNLTSYSYYTYELIKLQRMNYAEKIKQEENDKKILERKLSVNSKRNITPDGIPFKDNYIIASIEGNTKALHTPLSQYKKHSSISTLKLPLGELSSRNENLKLRRNLQGKERRSRLDQGNEVNEEEEGDGDHEDDDYFKRTRKPKRFTGLKYLGNKQ